MPLTRQGTYLRPRGYPNWRHSTSGETSYGFSWGSIILNQRYRKDIKHLF